MARRSPEQLIEIYKQKIQEQEEKLKSVKKSKLTKDSEGMQAVLDAINHAAEQNNVAAAEIIVAAAKMKRTGLKFENWNPISPNFIRDKARP